jgi:transcriptional regulator with PAS, ATPase and Fis domain
VLARHFWTAAALRVNSQATLSHGVIAALARYHWPGNVRELQNVMAALAVESPGRGMVRAILLPAVITRASAVRSARLGDARSEWERRFVEVALARAGGSRTRAARDLGLTRQGLLKVLARLGLIGAPAV